MTNLLSVKVAVVTNVPAPYRVPVWQRVAKAQGIELEVIYCGPPYIDPTLDASAHGFPHHYLKGPYWITERRFLHWDLGVLGLLSRISPDVVVTCGFIPTFLFAFAWARWHGAIHVPMTDGTLQSELVLTFVHRQLRRWVFSRSTAFVGASAGSADLYRKYGVGEKRIHVSCLCADNARFYLPPAPAPVDFIFCGRFVAHKNPLFALAVAHDAALRLGRRTTLDFVGRGVLEPQMRAMSAKLCETVAVRFHGYVSQADLPQRYADARILLFPSGGEPWGVVANEACAAGLPVIVTPHAGVAGELIVHRHNGFVIDLDAAAWGDAAVSLLADPRRYEVYSRAAREKVAQYTFDNSAQGMLNAIRQAVKDRAAEPSTVLSETDSLSPLHNRNRATASVCIIQQMVLGYRKPFFDRLFVRLADEGVELRVIYSAPNKVEALTRDSVDLPGEYGIKVPAYWLPGRFMVYQPALHMAMAADLVIVEQASKHLLNYLLLSLRALRKVRLAFWGHGRNWQDDGVKWMEPVKGFLVRHVDWWFAYTRRVAALVCASGFPEQRVTVVQNSVDLAEIRRALSGFGASQRVAMRDDLGIPAAAPVAVFCGRMHANKMLGYLLAAASAVRASLPDFHLILIGAGPHEQVAQEAASLQTWIHYLGPRFGEEKAKYLALADVFLCPGQVGLAVLDAFAVGLPVITTSVAIHSPEIDYIEHGVNGFVCPVDGAAYAESIVASLTDPAALQSLRQAALASAECFSLEAMVENFSKGVMACLHRS